MIDNEEDVGEEKRVVERKRKEKKLNKEEEERRIRNRIGRERERERRHDQIPPCLSFASPRAN